jgi:hypothetical protein
MEASIVPDISDLTEDVMLDVAQQQVLAHERAGHGQKVIAMSLFGDNSRYVQGAMSNAVLAQRDWPDWTLRFLYGDGVPVHALRVV